MAPELPSLLAQTTQAMPVLMPISHQTGIPKGRGLGRSCLCGLVRYKMA